MNDPISLVIAVAFGFAAGWMLGNSLGWDRGFAECSEIHSKAAADVANLTGGAK